MKEQMTAEGEGRLTKKRSKKTRRVSSRIGPEKSRK
jgi:hypothetical protein